MKHHFSSTFAIFASVHLLLSAILFFLLEGFVGTSSGLKYSILTGAIIAFVISYAITRPLDLPQTLYSKSLSLIFQTNCFTYIDDQPNIIIYPSAFGINVYISSALVGDIEKFKHTLSVYVKIINTQNLISKIFSFRFLSKHHVDDHTIDQLVVKQCGYGGTYTDLLKLCTGSPSSLVVPDFVSAFALVDLNIDKPNGLKYHIPTQTRVNFIKKL